MSPVVFTSPPFLTPACAFPRLCDRDLLIFLPLVLIGGGGWGSHIIKAAPPLVIANQSKIGVAISTLEQHQGVQLTN